MFLKKIKVIGMTLFVTIMTGCLSRPSSFMASAKPIEGEYAQRGNKEETGTHRQVFVLFFAIGKSGSGQYLALKDARDKVNNPIRDRNKKDGKDSEDGVFDALISMSVDTESFDLLPFFGGPLLGIYTTRVTGIPVKTSKK